MSRPTEGSELGRYRIVRRLGAGAMGEVYLAEDPQIGRPLAIKTVRVEEGKPQEIEDRKQRLLREARAAGKLLHPNIVTLFDAGEDQDLLFLAFEFVDGSDLDDRIAHGAPLTLAEALAIVRQAAEGLEYAHRQGVIHRDIKPSNLMLTRDGRVKVADFGIAKLVDATSNLTMSGSVVGSPHYLSPEQVRGEPLDGRTDIFSLGVMFYEMLCRQRPFDGQTLTTLVYQILNQEPTPIEARRGDLGPRVERLVRRMMHKDREQRFASAGELAAEIAACERELAPELLARSIAMPAEVVGPTLRLPTDASTAVRPPEPPTVPAPPPATTAVSHRTPPPPPAAAPPPAARGRIGLVLAAAAAALVLLVVAGVGARRWMAARDASAVAAAPERAETEPADVASAPPTAPAVAEPPPPTAAPKAAEPEPTTFEAGERVSTGKAAPTTPRSVESPAKPAAEPVASAPSVAKRAEPEPSTAASPAAPSETTAPVVATPAEPEPEPVAPAVAPTPAAEEAESRELRDEIVSRLPVAREMTTGMMLSFEIEPKEVAERLVVRLDRIVLGRAAEWNASKRGGRAYAIPEPGLHIVSFVLDGADVYRIRIDAQPGTPGPTRIQADLKQFSRRGRRPGGG